MDFTRAMYSRPTWARILFRLIAGRYAYREFIGLQDVLMREGHSPYYDYYCEDQEYHNDPVPFDFGVEREPISLRNDEYL